MVEQQSLSAPSALHYPKALKRLDLGTTKGAELVKNADSAEERARGNYLDTFLVGRRRYVEVAELQRFVRAMADRTKRETPAERAAKSAAATQASLASEKRKERVRKSRERRDQQHTQA